MHPALSVIFFTVVSGAGYGLLFLLALLLLFDPQAVIRAEWLLLLLTGAGAVAIGLASSLLHLGRPERAWRALSQWRSSWLSREGVSALASFVPLTALVWIIVSQAPAAASRIGAALLAALAVSTVYCTAQIYASLKTIPAWNNAGVVTNYFLCGLLCGTSWLLAVHCGFAALAPGLLGHAPERLDYLRPGLGALVAVLACMLMLAKRRYWRSIDTAPARSNIGAATGLDRFGAVHAAEAPHTERNYLLQEMGFAVARKHARRLRAIAASLLGPVPIFLSLVLIGLWIESIPGAPVCSLLAAASATGGCFVERWLFFAEARHVVTLFYGADQV